MRTHHHEQRPRSELGPHVHYDQFYHLVQTGSHCGARGKHSLRAPFQWQRQWCSIGRCENCRWPTRAAKVASFFKFVSNNSIRGLIIGELPLPWYSNTMHPVTALTLHASDLHVHIVVQQTAQDSVHSVNKEGRWESMCEHANVPDVHRRVIAGIPKVRHCFQMCCTISMFLQYILNRLIFKFLLQPSRSAGGPDADENSRKAAHRCPLCLQYSCPSRHLPGPFLHTNWSF